MAWQTNNFPSDLAAAVRLPGAAFSPARYIGHGAGDAQLAVSPGGRAVIATTRGAGLDISIKPPGADTMPTTHRIDHGEGFAVAVAAAGPGEVAIAWLAAARRNADARVRVFAAEAGNAGPRRVGTVGRDATGEQVGLAVDGAGAAVVAWEENLKAKNGSPEARSHLAIASRAAGGRFRAPVYAGPVSLDDTPEAVQMGPGGRAWVLYEAFASGDFGGGGYRRVYMTERTS